MSFDQIAFYQAVLDIEKYIGYLKGNELAFEYCEQVTSAEPPQGPEYIEGYFTHGLITRDWRTPCPEGEFQASFVQRDFSFLMPREASEDEIESVRQEILGNVDQSWRNGASWGDGIYEYVNDVTRQFVKPDVDAMAGSINLIATNVVDELSYGINDDWAGIQYLLDDWSGQGAGAFTEFYSNFNDVLARFGLMSGHVAAGFAMGTRLINGYQQAVMEFVEGVRSGLQIHLAFWVEHRGRPHFDVDLSTNIADQLKIAKAIYDVIKLIPAVKSVTAPIDAAITVAQSAKTLIGDMPSGGDVVKPYDFEGQTADAIYAEITEKIYDDFYVKYQESMDEINSPTAAVNPDHADDPGFSASGVEEQMLELQGQLDQWDLPEVPSGNLAGPNDTYPG